LHVQDSAVPGTVGYTSGITTAIGCASQFSRSTAGGTIVRINLKDGEI